MHMKVPNHSGNSFGGGDQSYEDHDQSNNSDYDDILELNSEGERTPTDFSDFLWMENEDQFETEVFASLEEQELVKECLEVMSEMTLLDDLREVEAEHNE